MAEASRGPLPPLPGLIGGALVGIGILLWMFVSKGLLFVAGLGVFGPGLLRELGWLRDHDEFQRQAAHRAGYHAYLLGGLAAVSVLALLEWSAPTAEEAMEWIRFIVVVLWLTWVFSALLAYWGARTTVSRMLRMVGSFWAVFVIASLVGDFSGNSLWLNLVGLGAGLMFVAPFFVLAWTVHRWPRATGIALLCVSAFLLVVLGWSVNMPLPAVVMTRVLLVGPMIATGIALLRDEHAGRLGGAGTADAA